MEDVGVDFVQTKIEVMYTVTHNSMIAMKGFILVDKVIVHVHVCMYV